MDEDVDARERLFYSVVREYIVSMWYCELDNLFVKVSKLDSSDCHLFIKAIVKHGDI